eukprot:1030013-Pyramimonas_sp.AAC.1
MNAAALTELASRSAYVFVNDNPDNAKSNFRKKRFACRELASSPNILINTTGWPACSVLGMMGMS